MGDCWTRSSDPSPFNSKGHRSYVRIEGDEARLRELRRANSGSQHLPQLASGGLEGGLWEAPLLAVGVGGGRGSPRFAEPGLCMPSLQILHVQPWMSRSHEFSIFFITHN